MQSVETVASSPFVELGCPFTVYEALKAIILLPLVPLRLGVGAFLLVVVAIVNGALAWNWPLDKPLTPWRRQMVLLSKELVLGTLWCLGFRIKVRGRENIQLGQKLGAVGVFNHVSWVDAFVLVWLLAPSGVSKADNAQLPVIGLAVRALQTVYIPYEKLAGRHRGRRGASTGSASPATPPSPPSDTAETSPLPGAAVGAGCDCSLVGCCRRGDSGSSGKGISGARSAAKGAEPSPQRFGCGCGCCRVAAGNSSPPTTWRDSPRTPPSSGSTASYSQVLRLGAASTPAGSEAATTSGSSPVGLASSPPPSAPSSPAPSYQSPAVARSAAFVVTSAVTEVLQRRVSDPGYCLPGGFPMLVMAPEGTTANGRGLLRFRTGAFALGRPVMPICLRYRWRGLNPAWTIGNARWHFLRLMCQFRNDLEVEILPPYRPSQDELKDPGLFAARVRRLMAACLGVPLVEASHDDYLQLRDWGVGVSWDGRRVVVRGREGRS